MRLLQRCLSVIALAAAFAPAAYSQKAVSDMDPAWPAIRGPFSLADRVMNSTVISRSGGIYMLRKKTAEIFTPAFRPVATPFQGTALQMDKNRLDFFSYVLNSRMYEDAAALLFADGLFPKSDTLSYLKGVLAYDIHDFSLAAGCFSEVSAASPFQPAAQSFLDVWAARPELPDYKKKSPLLAGAMSAVIPGSGKIYAGDLRSGVSSFLIVGALGLMAGEAWAKLGGSDWRTITLTSLCGLFYIADIYGSALSVSVIKQTYEDARKATLMFDLRIPLHQF